jgi:leucyl-tRNA synthetase
MFMGPLEATKPWQMSGVEGVYRFLARTWRMLADEDADDVRLNPAVKDAAPTEEQERLLHRTIKVVTQDIESLSFNTAISRMMEFVNAFSSSDVRPKSVCESFVLILSPFAPHLAEEIWASLGHPRSLAHELWPAADDALLVEDTFALVVQVGGKRRAELQVPVGITEAEVVERVLHEPELARYLGGKTPRRVVYVPGKLVNVVV